MWGAVEPHPLGSRADTHPDDVPKEVGCSFVSNEDCPLNIQVLVVQNDPTRGVRAVQVGPPYISPKK